MSSLNRRAMLLGCSVAALAGPAFAQAQTIKLSGGSNATLRGGAIAIPAYQVAFFTQHQGTAVGGVMTKSRLTTTLAGVGEADMRRMADEAYADLRAQLEAAGLPLAPQDEVKAAVAGSGVQLWPNNSEVTRIGAGITIGQSVKKAYAAYGATEAPGIDGLHAAGNPTGFAGMGALAVNNKLGAVAKPNKLVLVMPSLVFDFADTDAKGGRDFLGRESASASSKLKFSLSAVSMVSLMTSSPDGRFASPGFLRMTKPLAFDQPFATVATGEGAVRALSVSTVTDSNYIDRDAARGDAVVVDVPAWEALVREGYKTFNASVVAEFRKARGV